MTNSVSPDQCVVPFRAGIATLIQPGQQGSTMRLLRQTGNLKLVSRLLGHADVTTTTRYAHVLDQDLAEALDGFSIMGRPESRRKSRSSKK